MLLYGISPCPIVNRHRMSQRTVTIEDVAGILFFRWRKYGHAESRIVARDGADHNTARCPTEIYRLVLASRCIPGSTEFCWLEILIDFGRFPGMIPLPHYASHNLCSG